MWCKQNEMKKTIIIVLLALGVGNTGLPDRCICGQPFGHPVPVGTDIGSHGGWMDSDE